MVHYSSQLCNALSKTSSVHLITSGKVNRELFNGNVNIYPVPVPARSFYPGILRFNTLFKAVRDIKPDVVHITAIHPWVIWGLPFLKRYPLVITLHDVNMHLGERNPVLVLMKKMEKKFADKLIVHGTKLKEQLLAEGVAGERVEVIPLGAFSFLTRYKKEGIKEEDSILFFGRIVQYKGLEYLIEAQPLVTAAFPQVKIVIAGPGDFSRYERLIANRECFEIINKFIPDDEIAPLFEKAKIVVLPYVEASQSAIIGIAYAFRKPVIVTGVGGIPEVVDHGKTGFIVPPRDAAALAEAIIELLGKDNLRREMGQNAFAKMKQELSWDKIAERTIQVYERVCEERKRGEIR